MKAGPPRQFYCPGGPPSRSKNIMMQQAIEILNQLGITQVIQFVAVATGALFLYRYFTDRS